MQFNNGSNFKVVLFLCIVLPLSISAAEKKKPAAPDANQPSYDLPQPAKETINFAMYQRIRDEGLTHSHVMEFASALTDGIGPRLTGSPNLHRANEWTRDQLAAMGCSNAHLEDWGEFGIGWQQLNTWVRMTAPDTAVFIAQATPWSPATSGPVTADAAWVNIQSDDDFAKYQGELAGKIVLLGDLRPAPPIDASLFERYTDQQLADIASSPVNNNDGLTPEQRERIRT